MLLSKEENHNLFSYYFPLLFYAAVYEGLLPQTSVYADVMGTSMEVKIKARNALFMDKVILNYFKQDNKPTLTKEHLNFVKDVQSGILSNFMVLKQTKMFSVLYNEDNKIFYHVLNISESFEEMLGYIPTYIRAAIFNFNGKIICDGLISGGNIRIGKNIEKQVMEEYNEHKRNKTVKELIK